MWGVYDNFPEKVHRKACLPASPPKKKLRKTLVQLFRGLNCETFQLEDIAPPSIPQCTVMFDWGIAKAKTFHYLSEEETDKILRTIQEKNLRVMDFFCALRYYKTEKDSKTPLNFDYYILRFRFDRGTPEIQVFHEKGPRHLSPQGIIGFLVHQIDEKTASP